MIRVVVYRTDDEGEKACFCFSRRFDLMESAIAFAERENKKFNRKAEISA